jgi:hypothetical protein
MILISFCLDGCPAFAGAVTMICDHPEEDYCKHRPCIRYCCKLGMVFDFDTYNCSEFKLTNETEKQGSLQFIVLFQLQVLMEAVYDRIFLF